METGIWRTPKSWPDVEEKESQSATIYMKRHSATPLILTSFTYFDIRKDAVRNQIRAWCYADDVSPSHFRIHADTWADNLLYTAKVGWIAIPGGHTGILGGTCLVAPHEPDDDKKWNGMRIPFQEVFPRTPKIFICLNYIDIGRSWSIETFTENITTSSFDAVFTSRNPNVDVWSAGATWIAYEDDLDGVEGGSIYNGYWAGSNAQSWEGTVYFKKRFNAPPKIFFGFRRIVSDVYHNLRLLVDVKRVTDQYFEWKIEGWSDSINYQVNVEWLATGFHHSTIDTLVHDRTVMEAVTE